MSSSTIDSAAPTTATIRAVRAVPADRATSRAGLVTVAAVALATIALSVVSQTGAAAPAPSAASQPLVVTTSAVPALSQGAQLLAYAWQVAPATLRTEACTQFAADADAAWASYSGGGGTLATPTEFAAFLDAAC